MDSTFGIQNFDLIEEDNVLIIAYKKSPFKFYVRHKSDDFDLFDCRHVKYSPGFPLIDYTPKWEAFQKIKEYLESWLQNTIPKLLEDEAEPDLWEEFKKVNTSFNFDEIDFESREFFSYDEKVQIKLSLNDLKLLIHKNITTSEAEQKLVDERLDYLIEASNRLNKFDWKSLVVSSIISICIALTLDTEKGKMIFELLKKVFTTISLIGH